MASAIERYGDLIFGIKAIIAETFFSGEDLGFANIKSSVIYSEKVESGDKEVEDYEAYYEIRVGCKRTEIVCEEVSRNKILFKLNIEGLRANGVRMFGSFSFDLSSDEREAYAKGILDRGVTFERVDFDRYTEIFSIDFEKSNMTSSYTRGGADISKVYPKSSNYLLNPKTYEDEIRRLARHFPVEYLSAKVKEKS